MGDLPGIGKILIGFGALLVGVGLLITILPRFFSLGQGFSWLGRLPGDIFVKLENFTFYFPLATSLLISIVLSVAFYLFSKR